MRWCWVNYNFDTVGQGPTTLGVGAGGGCLDIFTLIYPFYPLSPSLWETARYSWLVGCFWLNRPLRQYSGTSTNGHLSTTATSLQQPVFNIPEMQFYYTFDLSIAVTSLQQPLFCCPMGGCCREVALYFSLYRAVSQREGERKEK